VVCLIALMLRLAQFSELSKVVLCMLLVDAVGVLLLGVFLL